MQNMPLINPNLPGEYAPREAVPPCKEFDNIMYYQDSNGCEYFGVPPTDPEMVGSFQQMINTESLENLTQKFPYQPLMVDRGTGMLITVPSIAGTPNPMSKYTNCFHVIYHMKKDQGMLAQPHVCKVGGEKSEITSAPTLQKNTNVKGPDEMSEKIEVLVINTEQDKPLTDRYKYLKEQAEKSIAQNGYVTAEITNMLLEQKKIEDELRRRIVIYKQAYEDHCKKAQNMPKSTEPPKEVITIDAPANESKPESKPNNNSDFQKKIQSIKKNFDERMKGYEEWRQQQEQKEIQKHKEYQQRQQQNQQQMDPATEYNYLANQLQPMYQQYIQQWNQTMDRQQKDLLSQQYQVQSQQIVARMNQLAEYLHQQQVIQQQTSQPQILTNHNPALNPASLLQQGSENRMYGYSMDCIDTSPKADSQTPQYSIPWDRILTKEPPPAPKYHDVNPVALVMTEKEANAHTHSFSRKQGGNITVEEATAPNYHPNANKAMSPEEVTRAIREEWLPQYANNRASMRSFDSMVSAQPESNTTEESYIPIFPHQLLMSSDKMNLIEKLQARAKGDLAAYYQVTGGKTPQNTMELATAINAAEKLRNPTLLDTSDDSHSVNFANPESFMNPNEARTTQEYLNPNRSKNIPDSKDPIVKTIDNRSSNSTFRRNLFNWWRADPGIDLGLDDREYIRYSKREKEILAKRNKKSEYRSDPEKKVYFSVTEGDKIIYTNDETINVEEHNAEVDRKAKAAAKAEEIRQMRLNKIYDLTKEVLKLGGKPIRQEPWYTPESGWQKLIEDTILEIDPYDRSLGMAMLGYLWCPDISPMTFNEIINLVRTAVQTYKRREKENPKVHYKLSYRYRETPEWKGDGWEPGWHPENELQKYEYWKDEGRGIKERRYRYDRGREPNIEEWAKFYGRAVDDLYESLQENREKEQEELKKLDDIIKKECLSYDWLEIERKKKASAWKNQQTNKRFWRMQSIKRMTDEEFNNWWYRYNPNDNPDKPKQDPDSDDAYLAERERLREEAYRKREDIIWNYMAPGVRPEVMYQRWLNEQAAIKLRFMEWEEGLPEKCQTLGDCFNMIEYLNNKCKMEEALANSYAINSQNNMDDTDATTKVHNAMGLDMYQNKSTKECVDLLREQFSANTSTYYKKNPAHIELGTFVASTSQTPIR